MSILLSFNSELRSDIQQLYAQAKVSVLILTNPQEKERCGSITFDEGKTVNFEDYGALTQPAFILPLRSNFRPSSLYVRE
ncbi:Uncharacterised protein [Bacillus freudenreichii]|nr:Uncharacterised protein [Bacillus freudenreichii]